MDDFLKTLYKMSQSYRSSGLDLLFQILPGLGGDRRFAELDELLVKMDLTKVNTSIMYTTVHMVSHYINVLPHYREFYQRCREEFARRGEKEKRIKDLFDGYQDGGDRLFDPNEPPRPPYRDSEELHEDKINAKIELAKQLGDKDLGDLLSYYKAERLAREERNREFRTLEQTVGEKEMRSRCIKSLREMADTLERTTGCFPGIYYCKLLDDPLLKKTFIDGIEVIISYPWPG